MDITRRALVLGGGSLALASAVPVRAAAGAALSGRAFGGAWKLVLSEGARAAALAPEIASALAEIDRAMSPFRPDSEIARFNRVACSDWQQAGPAFASLTAEALRIAALSGGAFDPSVGPDVARYGFGPITGVRTGDFEGFATAEGAIRKQNAGLSLDLCGIAKGHALDAIAARLDGAGVADFMLEIGGEVLARGNAPSGRRWLIGIADPVRGGVRLRVAPGRLALATSGDAVNAYEIAGRRYSHTIDPATGEPVRNGVASVTVAASTGATADALATALTVLGPERGLALAGRLDVAALFLVRNGAGIAELSNPRFDALRIA